MFECGHPRNCQCPVSTRPYVFQQVSPCEGLYLFHRYYHPKNLQVGRPAKKVPSLKKSPRSISGMLEVGKPWNDFIPCPNFSSYSCTHARARIHHGIRSPWLWQLCIRTDVSRPGGKKMKRRFRIKYLSGWGVGKPYCRPC